VTDVVIIGGGLNGLVAAAVLARAKRSVILLEAASTVGGAAATLELAPGFRAPAFSHALGPVSRDVIKALRLDRTGALEFITPEPSLASLDATGRSLVFHRDPVLTAASINQFSSNDAGRWREFLQSAHRVAGILALLDRRRPPDIDETSRGDAWFMLGVARAARKLGRRDLSRLVRWAPMSVADLLSEWFDSQVLSAAIAAHAIAGNPAGPRSAGTGAMLLQRLAADPMPAGSGITTKGGPGALVAAVADAARSAGADIRTDVRVTQIVAENGVASGVVLSNGDTLQAPTILAAVSPKLALTGLVAAPDLPPSVVQRMGHVRSRGVTAKINLALAAMPVFPALSDDAATLEGRILIAPTLDYLERAFDATKYGEISQEPWLEISIPSVRDDSLAPSGAHVMSIYAHFVPAAPRNMDESQSRAATWSAVLRVLEAHAPRIADLIVSQDVMTPRDLELRLGAPGGHIFHGETTLDQFWAARPLLGWGRYTTPIEGLFLGSAGVHPGGGLTGLPGLLAANAILTTTKK
jgi:phytoene dehydrogenase-like protein